MNKKAIGFTLSVFSSLIGSTAFAADGTISVTGFVVANTCKVEAGGTAGGNTSVALDKVSTATLATAGDTAGFKSFSIKLTGCEAALTGQVKAGFEVGATTDIASGRLITQGVAQNVQLQLRNEDNSVIKVGDNSTVKGASVVSGGATLNYLVGYYAAKAGVTAGALSSSVTYSVIYP